VYAAELYAIFLLAPLNRIDQQLRGGLLYIAHIFTMIAIVRVVDHRIGISVCWGVLALFWMIFAITKQERFVGQSSLLILFFAAMKVFFFDLRDATPLVRIICLIILAVTLFCGGWLYQRIEQKKALAPNTL
jgi:uncharacterized membrane protein